MDKTQFDDHRVWSVINDIEHYLGALPDEAQGQIQYQEVRDKFDYTIWLLKASDEKLFAVEDLDFFRSSLNEIRNSLRESNGTWATFPQINSTFTNIFREFSYPRIKRLHRSEVNEVISEQLSRLRSLEDLIDELEESISEIDAEAKATGLDIKARLSEFEASSRVRTHKPA
jgi:hypothetical protein